MIGTEKLNASPALVEVLRGNVVESVHHGIAAIVDASGKTVFAAGEIETPVFPRSAIKPLQALPLIESGAVEEYMLADENIALSCASHKGEEFHTETISHWLGSIGFEEKDLECGVHPPLDEAANKRLIRAGASPSQLHQNCSGQHTGFLCLCNMLSVDHLFYCSPEHPVQTLVAQTVGEMVGCDLARAPIAIDGCGAPTYAIPVKQLAMGMARLADPGKMSTDRARAARRIRDAMTRAPLFVDGNSGMVAAVIAATEGDALIKPGAEGVYCAALPKLGLGVALKIADGAMRAAEAAMLHLLDQLGVFTTEQRSRLVRYFDPTIRNLKGVETGAIRITQTLTLKPQNRRLGPVSP